MDTICIVDMTGNKILNVYEMLMFIFQIHLLEKNIFFQILSFAPSYNIYISLDSRDFSFLP